MPRSKKLSPEQDRIIARRLVRGDSMADLAKEFGVSRDTIKRIKKALGDGGTSTGAGDETDIKRLLNDYHIIDISSFTSKKLEQVRRELLLFEDPEEGWTYHITKDDPRRKLMGKWFRFIAYPESAPEGWKERFEGVAEIAVSPLHDKDKWFHDSPETVDRETGEIIPAGALYKAYKDFKKAHWHGIAEFERPISLLQASTIIQSITHGPAVQICGSLKASYEYFLHINHPDKYQGYFKDEIYRSEGFYIIPNNVEKSQIFQSICQYILDNEVDSRIELVRVFGDKPDYLQQMKSGSFISGLLAENWLKHNPDGRVKSVKIVGRSDKNGRKGN